MTTIILTAQQWDRRMKTIATKRLLKYKKALTATSMGRYFNDAVIEIRVNNPDSSVYEVNADRYDELRKLFMNNSDDELRTLGII